MATNAKCDLFFNYSKEITVKDIKSSGGMKEKKEEGVGQEDYEISVQGFINMTHSQLDLYELMSIIQAYERNLPPDRIATQALVSTYNGNTFFSIFEEKVKILENV